MLTKIQNKLKKHKLLKKVIENSSWIVMQNILTMILGVFVTAIVARYLGTEKYGTFNYVLSFVSLFSGIAAVGIHHISVKDLKFSPNEEGKILGTSFIIRLIIAIILIIVSETVLFLINGYDVTILTIGILLSSMMIFNCFEVIDYYNTATMNVKYSAIAKFVSYIVLVVIKLLVVFLDLGLIWYTVAYTFEFLIYAVALYFSYKLIHKKQNITCKWSFDKEYAKKLLSRSWYFALSSLMVTIYMRIDQAMLGSMLKDKSEVGIYSAAVRIAEMWAFVPNAIITALKPAVIEYKKNNEEKYKESLGRLYSIVSLTCIIFSVFIIMFSKLIINILYGAEYINAYKSLYILVIGTWFGIVGNVHYVWLVCENKGKYTLFYSFSGSILNVIFNIFLIPQYGGYGAAIATLISQVVANIFSFAIFKETRALTKNAIKAIFLVDLYKIIKEFFKKRRNISISNGANNG